MSHVYERVMARMWMSHGIYEQVAVDLAVEIKDAKTKCNPLLSLIAFNTAGKVCCSVLQCVAVCCSVLQCVAVCCCVLQCVAVSPSFLDRLQCGWQGVYKKFVVCCAGLQCDTAYSGVLQCVAVCCSIF